MKVKRDRDRKREIGAAQVGKCVVDLLQPLVVEALLSRKPLEEAKHFKTLQVLT